MAKFTHNGVQIEITKTERGYSITAGSRRAKCKDYFESYNKAESYVKYEIDRSKQWRRFPDLEGFGKIEIGH